MRIQILFLGTKGLIDVFEPLITATDTVFTIPTDLTESIRKNHSILPPLRNVLRLYLSNSPVAGVSMKPLLYALCIIIYLM